MNNPYGHLMIDIETMGNQSNSAIISVAAIEFSLETGEIGKMQPFYKNVSLKSCIDAGLQVNADTILWWMNQSENARKALTSAHQYHLSDVLHQLRSYVDACGSKDVQVWGNSARFDLGILSDAYGKIHSPIPWNFRNERCVRTLVAFNPEVKANFPFEGTEHNPIDDCLHQIKYCSAIWKSLKQNVEVKID